MKYLPFILSLTLLILPSLVWAQIPEFKTLVFIPGPGGSSLGDTADFGEYINALYALSIAIAALLAVIKIVIAGVKWMLTDVVTSKEEAKKDIWGAVIGLLIVLAAVMILYVINPSLTKSTIDLEKLETPTHIPPIKLVEPLDSSEYSGNGAMLWMETAGGDRGGFLKTCQLTFGSNQRLMEHGGYTYCISIPSSLAQYHATQYCPAGATKCDEIYSNQQTACEKLSGFYSFTPDPAVDGWAICIYNNK